MNQMMNLTMNLTMNRRRNRMSKNLPNPTNRCCTMKMICLMKRSCYTILMKIPNPIRSFSWLVQSTGWRYSKAYSFFVAQHYLKNYFWNCSPDSD